MHEYYSLPSSFHKFQMSRLDYNIEIDVTGIRYVDPFNRFA